MAEYQMALSREIDARLKTKCDKVADAFIMDDIGRSSIFLSIFYNSASMFYQCKCDLNFFIIIIYTFFVMRFLASDIPAYFLDPMCQKVDIYVICVIKSLEIRGFVDSLKP